LHVASPFILGTPKKDDDLIKPAVEGTVNVLAAAVEKGVKKVVLTSSIVAMDQGNDGKTLNGDSWSVEKECPAYPRSKLLAERAAWDVWRRYPGKFDLAVINPAFVHGPSFSKNEGASEEFMIKAMTKGFPALPEIQFGIVDVRDVALAHVRAM